MVFLKRIFNHQSKSITFAASILGGSALITGVLALFRDGLLANRFGGGQSLDVYFAAFIIPDFIFGILVAGGIISVFLPIFSESFNQNKEKAWYFANTVLNCFLILLIFLCSILIIFTPFFVKLVTPGFAEESKSLVVSLTRIMLLSPFFFVLSSLFSGILHYFNRFLAYSIAPILYNLGIIAGILFFVPLFGLWGLAYGVILGAFLHLVIQIPPAVLAGFRYKPVFNFKEPGFRKVFKLMIPRTIGAAASHLNLIVITAIGSTLVSGSIAIFNFSNNLQKFPITLIGVSFAAATFPVLAKAWTSGKREEFLEKLFSIFRQTLFLIIPISLLVFLLRAQLVRLILGTGQFGWLETRLTAASLGVFSFGIFAFALIPLITRAFFSFQDTKTPVLIGISSIVLNIILCFLFVWLLKSPNIFQSFMSGFLKLQGIKNIQVIGLPLALFLSGVFNFSLLSFFFYKKIARLGSTLKEILLIKLKEVYFSLKKVLIGSALMILFTYFALRVVALFVNMQTFLGVFCQVALAGLFGIFVYILITYFLKSPELRDIKSSILEQFTK